MNIDPQARPLFESSRLDTEWVGFQVGKSRTLQFIEICNVPLLVQLWSTSAAAERTAEFEAEQQRQTKIQKAQKREIEEREEAAFIDFLAALILRKRAKNCDFQT